MLYEGRPPTPIPLPADRGDASGSARSASGLNDTSPTARDDSNKFRRGISRLDRPCANVSRVHAVRMPINIADSRVSPLGLLYNSVSRGRKRAGWGPRLFSSLFKVDLSSALPPFIHLRSAVVASRRRLSPVFQIFVRNSVDFWNFPDFTSFLDFAI